MLSSQRPSTSTTNNHHHEDDQESEPIRDIHALAPPLPPPPAARARWETGSHRSHSIGSEGTSSSENFTTMSREFNALVIAGSAIGTSSNSNINNGSDNTDGNNTLLARIGEDDDDYIPEETNPLAIVPDNNPLEPEAGSNRRFVSTGVAELGADREVSLQRVKKEEVETKISAWQNAKIAKINNRFKREDAVINGWETEQVHKATSWMKKVERKLEEKRAKALEKMQNEVAKAHRKAEEKRASAEAKRGTKVARVLEIANLMRAVGRPPAKRSFF